ncbi:MULTISPECIES: cobaltochelatase subunit CobN [Rhodopseudomonas]|uniref:cobaltochelatase subunit CobN n=1 Tax=Rhodopseudomonas TaxID=1073 RepID=UPI00069AF794|nr:MULTISPECIES: cobaltochelatase subunit CobN [Rhodopseudomonas]NEW86982.1 cobaltochelatase subunit CobN [Rhodopseudomonas sp. WA056]
MTSIVRSLLVLIALAGLFGTPAQAEPERPVSIVVFARDPSSPAKGKLLEQIAQERGLALQWVFTDRARPAELAAKLAGADLVMFDWVMEFLLPQMFAQLGEPLKQFSGKVWGGAMWRRPDVAKGVTAEQGQRIHDYWVNGGVENLRHLMDYIKVDVMGRSGVSPPPAVTMPEQALYHPDAPGKVFADLDGYLAWRAPKPGQPVIGIGFHRLEFANDNTAHIDDLIRRIEAKGGFPLPFWDPNDGRKVAGLIVREGKTLPDALVSFTGVYTNVDEQKKWMGSIDRTVLQAIVYHGGDAEDWHNDQEGMPVSRQAVFYTLGEAAGRIDVTLIGAGRRGDERTEAIPAQMDALAERVLKQAALRLKPNADKKLAMFVWNSPAGEENFAASYLNVPASIVEIAKALRDDGYAIPAFDEQAVVDTLRKLIRPYYRSRDPAELTRLVDAGLAMRVPVAEYRAFLAKLPRETQQAMTELYGQPEDAYLVLRDGDRADFIVPRWQLGNLTILPQPLRGARRADEDGLTHDKTRPLHHAYRAVYYGVVHRAGVDAIVHLGTHGTQEWAPGKERAPSVADDTQSTIGNVPVIYPYTVANVGEAIIARRRGRATTISHNSPPFAPSGLHGEFTEFHELLHQFETGEQGGVRDAIGKQIVALAQKLKIDKDVGYDEARIAGDFPGFIAKVHAHLHSVGALPQPLGLHTFGKVAEADKTLLTILQILGPDYLEAFGEDPQEFLARPYDGIQHSEPFAALRKAVIDGVDLGFAPQAARPLLDEAKRHFAAFTSPLELDSLKRALRAGYVPTSTGNDPLRNPDAVPSGRNLYGFDPRKLPTKAAWEAGAKLGRDLIESYRAKNGRYPDKITFSLWSTETLNHFGVVESQILYLLGAEPIWNPRGDVVGVRVIPAKDLDRPRVDTVLSLTGLYRDNLPELLALLQGAVNRVAALEDELGNPLVANNRKVVEALLARGIDPERAKRLARVRMFGNESGSYGTSLPEATVASGSWDTEATLATSYLSRMSWLFGTDDDTRNVRLDGINLYAEALKGTKAAVLSRSSNNHGVVSIDHPFEYLGGIGLAVRHLEGKTPELFVSDLRNARDFRNQTVAEFMSQELRSRYFHPRYVKELMNERYAGATKMVDVVNNFWGWNVMDRGSVRADQWQEFFEVYVDDKLKLGIRDYFKQHHPAALAQISERMLEAVRKGYWDAPEDVVRKLVETHQEIARSRDLLVENRKFAEFVAGKAAGYGLLPVAEAKAEPARQDTAAATEQVQGIKLEKQADNAADQPDSHWLLYGIVLGMFGLGALWELARAGSAGGRRAAGSSGP